MEDKNLSTNVWNEKVISLNFFQHTRTLPHTPSWGDWVVWTYAYKVNVDGWEAHEFFENLSWGFYGRGIYGILDFGIHY